jgi:Rod binding domain-containing protein
MTGLSLECHGVSAGWAKALAASLPASVRLVEHGGELALIGGQGAWPDRLLGRMQAGQRRFILCDPGVGAAGQLDAVLSEAQRSAASIALCETHADNPAIAPFRAQLKGQYSAVTITGQGEAGIADLLLQQLRLARAAGFAPQAILHRTANTLQAVATLKASHGKEEVVLRLTAAVGRAGGAYHRLLAHGRVESACVQVWSEPAARPAHAFHIAEDSTMAQPTLYESAHRAILRAMAQAPADAGGAEALRQWHVDAKQALTMAQA